MAATSLTDATYYNDTYKTVMGAVTLPADSVGKYLYKASQLIRRYTFNNIDETQPITDDVQMCACEVAEKLYEADSYGNEHAGIKSESIGDQTTSYEDTQQNTTKLKEDAIGIIYTDLGDTGLMYAGV